MQRPLCQRTLSYWPMCTATGIVPEEQVHSLYNFVILFLLLFSALVSPNDVHQAAVMLAQVKSPFCLETFASGLAAVCKKEFGVAAILAQVTDLFNSNMRVDFYKDMTQLVEILQVPFSILVEVMMLAESKGLVCKDDTISALRFYPNFILNIL